MNSKNSNEMFIVQFFNYKITQSIWKQQACKQVKKAWLNKNRYSGF